MSNFKELEVKILNVNVDEIKSKLHKMGAEYIGENIQKIYTYDCYSPIIMYKLALADYKITKSSNSLKKIANIYSHIEPIINDNEKIQIKNITGFECVSEYILSNSKNVSIEILENSHIMNIIANSEKRFFKWIRLRQNGEKVELTVKYIYNVNPEYDINDVKEIEINVSSFEITNKLLEEMGYFRKKLVEKKRISYKYNNVNIEIDQWPLVSPYIEIEGENTADIYTVVEKLGFDVKDAKVMNTEDVYLGEGKDLNDYEVLTFREQILNNNIM